MKCNCVSPELSPERMVVQVSHSAHSQEGHLPQHRPLSSIFLLGKWIEAPGFARHHEEKS